MRFVQLLNTDCSHATALYFTSVPQSTWLFFFLKVFFCSAAVKALLLDRLRSHTSMLLASLMVFRVCRAEPVQSCREQRLKLWQRLSMAQLLVHGALGVSVDAAALLA